MYSLMIWWQEITKPLRVNHVNRVNHSDLQLEVHNLLMTLSQPSKA